MIVDTRGWLQRAPSTSQKTVASGVVILLVFASLFGSYQLQQKFDALQVFSQYDVLFDADPNQRIHMFMRGRGGGAEGVVHPLMSYYFLPIRAVAKAVVASGLTNTGEIEVRRMLALCVAPLLAAAKIAIVFFTLSMMGFSTPASTMVAAITGVSFSQLVFGSIPDHFILSGGLLAVAFLLGVYQHRNPPQGAGTVPWLVLSIIFTGVTITNLFLVLAVFAIFRLNVSRNLVAVTLATAKLGLLTLAGVLVCHTVMFNVAQQFASTDDANYTELLDEDAAWVGHWYESDITAKVMLVPQALADTVAPAASRAVGSRYAERPGAAYAHQITLKDAFNIRDPRAIVTVSVGIFVVLGAVLWLRSGHALAVPLVCAATAVLVMNMALHVVWGGEFFLYSQHWHVALVFLLAGMLVPQPHFTRWKTAGPLLVGVLTLGICIANGITINEMLTTLHAVVRQA